VSTYFYLKKYSNKFSYTVSLLQFFTLFFPYDNKVMYYQFDEIQWMINEILLKRCFRHISLKLGAMTL